MILLNNQESLTDMHDTNGMIISYDVKTGKNFCNSKNNPLETQEFFITDYEDYKKIG